MATTPKEFRLITVGVSLGALAMLVMSSFQRGTTLWFIAPLMFTAGAVTVFLLIKRDPREATESNKSDDSSLTIQDELNTAHAELAKAKASADNCMNDMEKIRGERDSLLAKMEKGIASTERNTLLTIIAALCDYSAIKTDDRGTANQIAKLTEEIGAAVSDDTVRRWLKMIPDALESRMK